MGFFDSKSESNPTNQSAGFSEIAGPVSSLQFSRIASGKNSSATLNLLDGGAITESYKFAGDALERSLRQVEVTTGGAFKALTEASRDDAENVLLQSGKWLVIAVIAVAGFFALGKLKG